MIRKILLGLMLVVVALLVIFYKKELPVEALKLTYSNADSKFMTLMGMNIHYRDQGNKNDSIPLVLIHGTSSSLHTWDSLVARISNSKRVVRLDLPAFGLTGPNPSGDYSIGFYNRLVDSFLTKLGIQQYAIAGNSLGGGIAWNQALFSPLKVKQLILINSSGYPRKQEKGTIGFKLAAMPFVGTLLSKFTPKSLIRKSIEDVYAVDSRIKEELINRYYDLLLREGNRQATIEIFKQRIKPSPERISGIHLPTLIIWGEDDQLIDVSNAYLFNKDIHGSKLVIIKKSGHVPMEETPDEVFKALANFLSIQ